MHGGDRANQSEAEAEPVVPRSIGQPRERQKQPI
jgi:hypothetical protein